jgi:hypothetical protein
MPDAPAPTPSAPEPPAAATTPPAPTPAAPVEPPKPTDPPAATNPWADPVAAEAEIKRLRAENGAARTNAKAQAAEDAKRELAQQIGKALGLVADDTPVDPVVLTEQLATSQAEAQRARVELAVFRAASAVNGDPAALLDSQSFLASLKSIDPNDTAAVQAAISTAVAANPRLGAAPSDPKAPAPNPAQGSSGAGPVTAAQLTEADVKRLYAERKYDEIEKARQEGRLSSLLGA